MSAGRGTIAEKSAESLATARLTNSFLLARIRLAMAFAFLVLITTLVYALGRADWASGLLPTAIYSTVAAGLFVLVSVNPSAASSLKFAVPLVDMPMVFWVQWTNLEAASHPEGVAAFSIGLLMFLIILAAMTLDSRQVYLAGLMAIVCHLILHWEAEVSLGGTLSGVILLAGTAWISSYAGRERRKMIHQVAGESVKRSRLERYFSPTVAAHLETREEAEAMNAGASRELTILFSDLRGFTALSESMSSEEVVQLLNDYHSHMVDAIFRFGGTLDKYLGDGIMAYFNAPLGQEDHASRALTCALAMQEELTKLNEKRAQKNQAPLRMGIGVHTGPAVVGDIGAPQRREFTAIGDPVNLASRLESLTKEKDTDIIISESTRDHLPKETNLRALGHTAVRGKQEPVAIFTPA